MSLFTGPRRLPLSSFINHPTISGFFEADFGVYQDTNGTIPAVADDDNVLLWKNQVIGRLDLIDNSTLGNHPQLKTVSTGSRPALLYNPNHSRGFSLNYPFSGVSEVTGGFTIFIVFKRATGSNSSSSLFQNNGPSPANLLYDLEMLSGTLSYTMGGGDGTTTSTIAYARDVGQIAMIEDRHARGRVWVNGVASTSLYPPGLDKSFSVGVAIGARPSLVNVDDNATATDAEISAVAIFNLDMTGRTQLRKDVEGYFGQKYGISTPP